MAQWRNQIEIKQYLSGEESDEAVRKLVERLIPQLKAVWRGENKRTQKLDEGHYKENIEHATDELMGLIEEFEWIKKAVETGENVSDYGYQNWCEAFNNYFEQLYDLADTPLKYESHFNQEKYLWVG